MPIAANIPRSLTPPVDQAESLRVLKNALANGFDTTKLAGLRDQESREHRTSYANLSGLTDPQSVAERARQRELGGMVDDDIAADPFTGDAAQADTERLDDTIQDANTWARPDVTNEREGNEKLKRLLAGVAPTIQGNTARDVAMIAADAKGSGGEGWAEPTVGIPDPYGSGASYPVPRSIAANPKATKDFIDQYRAQGIGGQQGQGDRSTINAMNSLIDVLGETWRTGESADWKGLGPVAGTLGSKMYRLTGSDMFSNPQEEALRNQVGRVKAREAFGEGGKAFTHTEEQLVDQFIASLGDNPSATRTRLSQSMQHAAIQLMNRGVARPIVEEKIRQALGGAADVDMMNSIFGDTGSSPQGGGGGDITNPNWGAKGF